MDEDKVLAKLQELKAREEAKAQEQALKEAKQKQEAEERAIEQEALRRYEEEKVNAYIQANDIKALFDYIGYAKKRAYAPNGRYFESSTYFIPNLPIPDNNQSWKSGFIKFYNQYVVISPHTNRYKHISKECVQRLFDTVWRICYSL